MSLKNCIYDLCCAVVADTADGIILKQSTVNRKCPVIGDGGVSVAVGIG